MDPFRLLFFFQHWDHGGGNEEAVQLLSRSDTHGKPIVYGGKNDNAQAATNILDHNAIFSIGKLNVRTYWTPCHTPGHVLYHVTVPEGSTTEKSEPASECPYIQRDTVSAGNSGALFTGDTLFVAGCGRFNSGSPEQMFYALVELISELPEDTKIFVGHEYTKKNLMFAHSVEPGNPDVKTLMDRMEKQRNAGHPTVPSTVRQENATNPFIRLRSSEIVDFACRGGAITTADKDKILDESVPLSEKKIPLVKTLAYLRQSKNRFGTGSR